MLTVIGVLAVPHAQVYGCSFLATMASIKVTQAQAIAEVRWPAIELRSDVSRSIASDWLLSGAHFNQNQIGYNLPESVKNLLVIKTL